MDSDLQAVEDAEVRLESRSRTRRAMIERRDRRRRLLPWLLCLFPLPLLGAAAMLAVLRSAGGDLRGWPASTAALAIAACVLIPGLAAGWVGRSHGRLDAVLWALVTAALVLALVFGAGFALLDLGP